MYERSDFMSKCECIKCNCVHKDVVDDVNKKMLADEILQDMADFFKVFGDNTRLKIINALLNAKMCVSDIASLLNMTHSAISHQLIFLKENKIVKYQKNGKVVYYELDDDHIRSIFDEGYEHINE